MSGITVTGHGEASGAPDLAVILIAVSVTRERVGDAGARAAEAAGALTAVLSAAGIADRDVQTQRYSVSPEWDHRGDAPRMSGYRVDNALQVRVRDITRVGEVIDAAVGAGGDAVRIDGILFSIDDEHELEAAARAAAWEDAAAKAAHLAELAGVTLGAPLGIEEALPPGPAPVMRAAAAERAGTPIAPGETSATVALTVTFAIGD